MKKRFLLGAFTSLVLPTTMVVACGTTQSNLTDADQELINAVQTEEFSQALEEEWITEVLNENYKDDEDDLKTLKNDVAETLIFVGLQGDSSYLTNIANEILEKSTTDEETDKAIDNIQKYELNKQYLNGEWICTDEAINYLLEEDKIDFGKQVNQIIVSTTYLSLGKEEWEDVFGDDENLSDSEEVIEETNFVLIKEAIEQKYALSWILTLDENDSLSYRTLDLSSDLDGDKDVLVYYEDEDKYLDVSYDETNDEYIVEDGDGNLSVIYDDEEDRYVVTDNNTGTKDYCEYLNEGLNEDDPLDITKTITVEESLLAKAGYETEHKTIENFDSYYGFENETFNSSTADARYQDYYDRIGFEGVTTITEGNEELDFTDDLESWKTYRSSSDPIEGYVQEGKLVTAEEYEMTPDHETYIEITKIIGILPYYDDSTDVIKFNEDVFDLDQLKILFAILNPALYEKAVEYYTEKEEPIVIDLEDDYLNELLYEDGNMYIIEPEE